MWNCDSWTVRRHHHFLLFSLFWKYFLIISIYQWIWTGTREPRSPTRHCKRFQLHWKYLTTEFMFAVTLHILLNHHFFGVLMCQKWQMLILFLFWYCLLPFASKNNNFKALFQKVVYFHMYHLNTLVIFSMFSKYNLTSNDHFISLTPSIFLHFYLSITSGLQFVQIRWNLTACDKASTNNRAQTYLFLW